jgi:hypothetical protein
LIRHDEISGSQEVNATSDDEAQNASAMDEDSLSNDNESVVSQPVGLGTPLKKTKKRKEGSEVGSAKKKQKYLTVNFS